MASRGGIYFDKKKREVKPQYFVKEARYHPNGFTVYKVICRVPDPNSFDCFKESFVWKRYSDFRELYKCLATLHRKLYLNGAVPEFAKPKLFGRFEDNVVEERKESAENVLNFATQHPALLKSLAFKEFFLGLRPIDSTSEIRYLKQAPLKPNVKKERKSVEGSDQENPVDPAQSHLTNEDLELFDPFTSTKEFIESTSTHQDETWIEQIKKNFPSADPEPSSGKYQPRELDSEEEAELLEALKVTVSYGDLENYHQKQKSSTGCERKLAKDNDEDSQLDAEVRNVPVMPNMDLERVYSDDVNAREKHRKSSKASAYLEAVLKQTEPDNSKSTSGLSDDDQSSKIQSESRIAGSPGCKNGGLNLLDKPAFAGMTTRSSLLDLPKMFRDESSDDESKGAYVVQAAQQISFARAAEAKMSYEEAFGHYKTAINTLLQGVQGDTNESRIQAVRRKTANYLKRAEDIHSNHLKTTIDTNDLWKPDRTSSSPRPTILQPSDVQRTRRDTSSPVPSIPSPRHNSKDLSAYKVLGTIGKVLLVLDTRNNETYVMKILIKSCQNRLRKGVIPTNVPYMVRLHRYYSTDQAVCLLIEHASGGKLWDQLAPYFELAKVKNSTEKFPGSTKSKVPTHLIGGVSSTPKKLGSLEHSEEAEEHDSDSPEEKGSTSFLDVCMEYQTEDPEQARMRSGQNKPVLPCLDGDQPQSLNDAIEPSEVVTAPQSQPEPIQRSWSYLSWDEGTSAPPDRDNNATKSHTDVFDDGPNKDNVDPDLGWRTNFKKISSQGDLKLFTIDPEGDDIQEDSIYDSRSNEVSEDDNDDMVDGKHRIARELLSEQDMSAVSLLDGDVEKNLVSGVTSQETSTLRSASPSLTRLVDESKSSPCLSMNSSFEEDRRKSEEDKDNQNQTPVITRVVDENGVSSVDAKTLFRTHSRTRSTASISETKSLDKPDIVKDVVVEEDEVDGNDNKIHSIFVGLDEAKKKSMSYRIPEYTIQRWAAEIVIAVGTLHSIAILCRDLSPENILLSADGHIRLSYFGKWRQVERKPCDKLADKQMYVAPEMSKVSEKKTEACDWWSVGVILYELMTGMPLRVAHPSGISSHTVLSLPDYLSPEAKSLLTGLLQYYPTQRLGYGITGLDDLMNHPFFSDTEWPFLIEELSGS